MLPKRYTLINKIFIYFFILFTTHLFNYANWNTTIAGWSSYFIYAYLVLFVYNNKNKICHIKSPVSKWIKFFIGIPMLCLITRFVLEGVSPYAERSLIFSLLTFLFFYYFYIHHVSEKALVQIFTCIGTLIFIIQIVQQLFPSIAVFGIYNPDNETVNDAIAEIRNGLYRYRIIGISFTLLCLYYYWARICNKIKFKDVILFLMFWVSMYLFLTRQVMFATLVTLTLSSFFISNAKKRYAILALTSILIIVLIIYSDLLFGDLISQTKEQATDEDVRVLALSFYWGKIIENPLSFLLGNGHPDEFVFWQENYHFFTSDIGFVGEMYHYGALWIIFYLYVLYSLLVKYRKVVPFYIKLFLFGTAINSIMIFPYRSAYEYFVWASILYICALHINKRYESTFLRTNSGHV